MDNPQTTTSPPVTIDEALARRIQEELGENVYLCYQCVKCTGGCPLGEFLDWQPNQVIRASNLASFWMTRLSLIRVWPPAVPAPESCTC